MKTIRQTSKRLASLLLALALVLSLGTTAFAASGTGGNTSEIASVTKIDPSDMQDGDYYILSMSGINCGDNCLQNHGNSGGTFAMSNNRNSYIYSDNDPYVLNHISFDGTVNTATVSMVWKYESNNDGYSFQAYSAEGPNNYLNIVDGESKTEGKADLTLGAQQSLKVTASGETITISLGSYNVRFTGGRGAGFEAGNSPNTVNFTVYKVTFREDTPSGGDDASEITSVARIASSELKDGGYYVLAVANINCRYNGAKCLHEDHESVNTTYAMSSKRNGYDYASMPAAYILDHESYDGSVEKTTTDLIWKYESYNGGHSFQAYSAQGENSYLNITQRGSYHDLTLGAQQALSVTPTGTDTIKISLDNYNVRFTSVTGSGYQAGTGTNSLDFMIYEVTFGNDTPGGGETKPQVVTRISGDDIKSGGMYLFSMPNIQSSFGVGSSPALSNLGNGYDKNNARIASPFDGTANTVYENVIWQVKEYGSGYSLKAYSVEGENAFLNFAEGNLDGNNTEASLALGTEQELTLTVRDDGCVRISHVIDGFTYNLRFTGGHGKGYEADVAEASSYFNVYAVDVSKLPQIKDEEEVRETPLYTIAALTDMHVDYGLEKQEDVIRQVTRQALETIKEKEDPDMVLSAGDMTSTNGSTAPWDMEVYNKTVQQLTQALAGASKDGKVLYVNGNHDYQIGGTAYNSGAYIDSAMRNGVGNYTDVLYEDADRQSNLLAYYYYIDGIHYIGLNTPYNGDDAISGYLYTENSINWVENKLKSIPNDDLIIFLAHYPLQDSRSITAASKGLSDSNGANTRLKQILLNYPNLIYLYGHDHGGPFIEKDTFERVTAYNADGSIEANSDKRATGFTSSFMGSLSYYNNRYNSGWLSAAQPQVVQVLMVYVYADHVDLQMKNYGNQVGIRRYPSSYTIPLVKGIASEVYQINATEGTISGVSHNTTVSEFLSNLEDNESLKVVDFSGNIITDTTREVRSDMKVRYLLGESSAAELTIRVDRAAESDMPYTVEAVAMQDANGQRVCALRNASAITSITVRANASGAGEATAIVGLYDADGQLIRSAQAAINGSGTYDISLPLSDLPAGTTWRAVIYSSLTTMTAASYPLTSDDDRYALTTTATSAQTELVAGVDQRERKLVVFNQNSEDWNNNSSVVWKWTPTVSNGFDNASAYSNASDAKLRYSDYYGGYVVVTTSSGGFVGIVDYETGESLYSRNIAYDGNLHATELLPDGNLVVAGSTGNSVTVFASSQGDGNGYYKKYTFEDAHGLLWDPDLEVLWALGGSQLTAYRLTGTQAKPELEQQAELTFDLPTSGGHDLYPVYGQENKFWVTTVSGLYQFDTDTGSFAAYDEGGANGINVGDIKSIGNQPYSGTIVRAVADVENDYAVWCTDTIELFIPRENGTWQSVRRTVTSDDYYKDRVWHYKYQ